MSPDCIQNVDNSQALPASAALYAKSVSTPPNGERVIRIGVSAWRVGPRPQRPQPAASRRTTAATSVSGNPTGQAADAASRSASSPSRSEDASASRA